MKLITGAIKGDHLQQCILITCDTPPQACDTPPQACDTPPQACDTPPQAVSCNNNCFTVTTFPASLV